MKKHILNILCIVIIFSFLLSLIGCNRSIISEETYVSDTGIGNVYGQSTELESKNENVETENNIKNKPENETNEDKENNKDIGDDNLTTPDTPITPSEPETPSDPEAPNEPEVPATPQYVTKNINWKELYDSGKMRAQWWNDIGNAQNNYTSLFKVTATENSLSSTPIGNGDNRTYYSTTMFDITNSTNYEYTFEAKNNRYGGYAGVIFAYDISKNLPYFAYGEFDNNSDKGACIHIRYRKGHFDTTSYDCKINNNEVTAKIKETSDGYGQFKVIYEGFNVKFCYLNDANEYVQLGDIITLPAGSKICVGVFSRDGASAEQRTISLKNCVLTIKDETAEEDSLNGSTSEFNKTFNLKVGTYNIFHAEKAGYDLSKIANTIKNSGLEIIGLQEVDHYTKRNNWKNQTSEIAAKLGYSHRVFFKAINHDQGEYGLAIISKYPIQKHELIKLSSGSGEQRILAHAEILVENTIVHFFVTHLSYDGESGSRATQFKEIANTLAKYDNFILSGDFNTRNFNEYSVIKNSALVNNSSTNLITYPDGKSPLDNLVYSTSVFTSAAPQVVTNSYSDHYMLWTTITYTEK